MDGWTGLEPGGSHDIVNDLRQIFAYGSSLVAPVHFETEATSCPATAGILPHLGNAGVRGSCLAPKELRLPCPCLEGERSLTVSVAPVLDPREGETAHLAGRRSSYTQGGREGGRITSGFNELRAVFPFGKSPAPANGNGLMALRIQPPRRPSTFVRCNPGGTLGRTCLTFFRWALVLSARRSLRQTAWMTNSPLNAKAYAANVAPP
jgi:hypothetical protein